MKGRFKKIALLKKSRLYEIAHHCLLAITNAIVTGQFVTQFLLWLGKPVSVCALVSALPELGSCIQIFSPFFFERLFYRKKYVITGLLIYHLLLSSAFLLMLLVPGFPFRLFLIMAVIAFLIAGFLGPAYTQWMMELAPPGNENSFFAKRSVIASFFRIVTLFFLSISMDYLKGKGKEKEGLILVFGLVSLLSLVKFILQTKVIEPKGNRPVSISFSDLLAPFRDRAFLPVLTTSVFWQLATGVSAGFFNSYFIKELGLNNVWISSLNMGSILLNFGIKNLLWPSENKTNLKRDMTLSFFLMTVCFIGWFLLPRNMLVPAIFLFMLQRVGSMVYNSSYLSLQYRLLPEERKTVYISVASTAGYIVYCLATALGAAAQFFLSRILTNEGYSVLFAASASLFFLGLLYVKSGIRLPE